jgi:lipid-binding SYLF domain-containing protein
MSKHFCHSIALIVTLGLIAATGPVMGGEEQPSAKELDLMAKRAKIDETAQAGLDEVLANAEKGQALFDQATGWAVFSNLKVAIGLSGGGGNGVAVDKASEARTYMKMGTGGIGFGLGAQKYQVILFFQDETTFSNFVEKGWQADASAQAAAGTEGANAASGFVNGVAVVQITDKGLIASADISGTKYWKNDKLND